MKCPPSIHPGYLVARMDGLSHVNSLLAAERFRVLFEGDRARISILTNEYGQHLHAAYVQEKLLGDRYYFYWHLRWTSDPYHRPKIDSSQLHICWANRYEDLQTRPHEDYEFFD